MLTSKERAEKARIDRKVATGKATRKQVLRGLDLIRKARAETSREGRV